MSPEELKVIADLTVELTKLRLKECAHLCVENFSPELFGKLLAENGKPIMSPIFKADSELKLIRKNNYLTSLTAEYLSGAIGFAEFQQKVGDIEK